MDNDVRELLESAEFRRYHEEQQAPRFNPFDVLRYAEYEIRHSNVLAWLLTPGESHGLGDKFLRRFIESLASRPDILKSDFRTEKVEVKREWYSEGHYVDIIVFLNDERMLVAIENKVVGVHGDAIGQVNAYEEELRKNYEGNYEIHSVLLTASSDKDGAAFVDRHRGKEREGARRRPMSHMSWHRIQEIIKSLYPDDFEAGSDVHTFVRHYLEVVERIVHPGEPVVEKLLDRHTRTLERLSEANGAAAIEQVDESRRKSLKKLIGAFQQRPDKQRLKIEEFLKSKHGITPERSARGSTCWLRWESQEGSQALKLGWSLIWSIEFSYGAVAVSLYSPPYVKGAAKENVIRFIRRNPIDAWQPPRKATGYPMKPDSFGYFVVYENRLLESKDLADLSFRESTERLREKLDEFFARGSDYDRIESYFRCLAFDAGMAESTERQPQE